MRIRTYFTFILPLVLVLSIALVILISGLLGKPLISLPSLGLVREEKILSSELLLEEIREMGMLYTLEYVHKTVFPYDFLDPGLNYESILRTLRSGTGSVRELLSPAEQEYLSTRNLANRLGIRTAGGAADFVVATVIVRAGIDLSSVRMEIREEGRAKSVTATLPRADIIDLIIEDPHSGNYPYPDIKLNPAAWREIAKYIEERIRQKIISEGILETARESGIQFLRSFFLQSGFSGIEIIEN